MFENRFNTSNTRINSITFRATNQETELLNKYSKELGINRSDLIKHALKEFFEKEGKI